MCLCVLGEGIQSEFRGKRTCIQSCPLSTDLDDSHSLPSWETFLYGFFQACRVLAQTETDVFSQPSCCPPKGLHQCCGLLHAGNPYWLPDMWRLIGYSYLQILGKYPRSLVTPRLELVQTLLAWVNMHSTHSLLHNHLLWLTVTNSLFACKNANLTQTNTEKGVYLYFIQAPAF